MQIYLRKFSYNVNIFLKEKLQFAERLRQLMEKKRVSNPQLAKEIGLSHVSIGNYLQGQMPKSEHLLALANYFDVTTDWLVGRESAASTTTAAAAMRETPPPEYLLDDVLAELDALKEKMASLERAVRRLKGEQPAKAADSLRRFKTDAEKS